MRSKQTFLSSSTHATFMVTRKVWLIILTGELRDLTDSQKTSDLGLISQIRLYHFSSLTLHRVCNRAYPVRPPLWSSGQSSWLQIQRSGVRIPEIPDFLRSSGSGTVSTEPLEYN
jgi:hypothetical protein